MEPNNFPTSGYLMVANGQQVPTLGPVNFYMKLEELGTHSRPNGFRPPTTLKEATATDTINAVETRDKTRQKLATTPQTDLEVPETPEEDKIVDPADLPNQDQWPFIQQQIADAQKTDPTLDQTRQKVEN
uniref:Uncharacterized protein n=1 Tax=Romanomermis culicivorax TaxID=13658 RepID=A0A915K1A2_ROMCU